MSWIATAIGLGLTAAGTGMQIAGGEEAAGAMKKTRSEYAAKQRASDEQATNLWKQMADKSTVEQANKDQQTGEQARATNTEAIRQSSLGSGAALPTNAPTTYRVAGADTGGQRANAWSKLVGGAQNKLGGYDDAAGQQARRSADTSQRIGVVNNFAHGNANLLPIELDVASHKGDAMKGWGQLVSALGAMTSMGAGAKSNPYAAVKNYVSPAPNSPILAPAASTDFLGNIMSGGSGF